MNQVLGGNVTVAVGRDTQSSPKKKTGTGSAHPSKYRAKKRGVRMPCTRVRERAPRRPFLIVYFFTLWRQVTNSLTLTSASSPASRFLSPC